jgi:predicted phosphate transport protein (TIGR00153 family)
MPSPRRVFARGGSYFDLFEAAARNVLAAAELLERLLANFPDSRELAGKIRELEHQGDRITHDIIELLNRGTATALDREDVVGLASALDDIVDYIEEVADYLGLYRIEAPMDQALELARVLQTAAAEISQAISLLRGGRDLTAHALEVGRLENEGDRIARGAVASLFDEGIDPLFVIRWKDLFERLEAAIDATDHVAHILEGIAIKRA